MDPEFKELLQASLELAKENNKMLHKIRGVQKREFIWNTIKIIVIIGVALGSFYFIEPYLNKVVDLYNSISGVQQNIKDVSDSTSSFKDFLKKF